MKTADWPRKESAAATIGTSIKTLERLVKKGEIEQAMTPQPGGNDVAVFNPKDLARIAAKIATRKGNGRPFVMPAGADVPSAPAVSNLPLLAKDASTVADFAELLGAAIARALAEDRAKALAEEHAPVFTQNEAAKYARRSAKNLRELRKQGKLPNAGTPGRVLYRRADIDSL